MSKSKNFHEKVETKNYELIALIFGASVNMHNSQEQPSYIFTRSMLYIIKK